MGTTPHVDVIVLVGDLGTGAGPVEVLSTAPTQDGPAPTQDGPAWVVLTDDVPVEIVIGAGARGCLAVSSTPLQIGAAVRAAARGDRADLDHPVIGPLVQRRPHATSPLTEREVEILRLVAAGLGNRHIAARLYLSVSSVKSHLSHVYGRLGVSRRNAAVAEARRQGLL